MMSRTTRRLTAALAAGALAAGLGACSDADSVAEQAKANPDAGYIAGDGSIVVRAEDQRKEPVELQGDTLDGKPFSMADHRGEVVVVNSWASWCGPCEREAPHLVAVAERYKKAKKPVQMVGINFREPSVDTGKAQADVWGFTWPSVFDKSGRSAIDMQGYLKATPSTAVLDRQGRVAAVVNGATTESTLTGLVDDVLAEGAKG